MLGTIGFSIKKLVDHQQVEVGNNITVFIELTNNGTISIKDFILNDILSFKHEDFSLLAGKLVNDFSSYLNPGETVTFSYVINAETQKTVNLSRAFIDYYYLRKLQDQSNEVEIKIVDLRIVQSLFLIVPCIIGLSVLGAYYWNKNKYNAEKYELQRSELLLFGLSSKDSLLRIEHTLKERLDIVLKNERFQNRDNKKNIRNMIPKDEKRGEIK